MPADAAAPLRFSAVVKGWVESDVLDQLLGVGEALDVSDKSAQREGDDFTDPAQPHDGKQFRLGQHLLGNETAPVLALLVGVAQFRQEDFDYLPLTRGPRPRLANLRFDRPAFRQARARLEPHPVVTEVRAQPRLHLRGAFGGLAVSVEPSRHS